MGNFITYKENSPTIILRVAQKYDSTGVLVASLNGKAVNRVNWFPTKEELERFWINKILNDATWHNPHLANRNVLVSLEARIASARNHIAAKTLRGRGNLLIVGPKINGKDARDYVLKLKLKSQGLADMQVILHEDIPEDTSVVMYQHTPAAPMSVDGPIAAWCDCAGYSLFYDDRTMDYVKLLPLS